MNKELDRLLCLLDGKITAHRMKDDSNSDLLLIQQAIQHMWDENRA